MVQGVPRCLADPLRSDPDPWHTPAQGGQSPLVGRWGSTLPGGCRGCCRRWVDTGPRSKGPPSPRHCSPPPPQRGCSESRHIRCHSNSLLSSHHNYIRPQPGPWAQVWVLGLQRPWVLPDRLPEQPPATVGEPWLFRSAWWCGGVGHSKEEGLAVPGGSGHVNSSLPTPARDLAAPWAASV